MTVHPVAVGHEALADYALLFAEACEVLTDLAEASEPQRTDDYDTLQEIYAEGADLHSGVIVTDDEPVLHALPALLRDMFGDVMRLAERLRDLPQSASMVASLHVVEDIAVALSAALENLEDDADVDRRSALVAERAHRLGAPDPYHATTPVGRLLSSASSARDGLSSLASTVPAA